MKKRKALILPVSLAAGHSVFVRRLLVACLGKRLNPAFYVINDNIPVNIFCRFDGQAQVVVAINKWRI